MSEFGPPPFSLVVIALTQNYHRIPVLECELIIVLRLVIEHRIHLSVIHNAQFLLYACNDEREAH